MQGRYRERRSSSSSNPGQRQGNASNPIILETLKEKGRALTSSYEEEKAALKLAMKWIVLKPQTSIAICSDSQSLLKAIGCMSLDTAPFRDKFNKLSSNLTLQWVPGHENVPGNELTDQAAKKATTMRPISFSAGRAAIKRHIKDQAPTHSLVKVTYKDHSAKRDKEIPSRKDAALIAQLRSGHCLI